MLRMRNLSRSMKKAVRDPVYSFSVLKKRFSAWLAYSFGDGTSPCPETISLFLTYRCNLRCKMCGQWGEDGWARKLAPEALATELSLERIDSLLDDVAAWKPAITLFGGEPLLYSKWEDLVRHIKSRGLRVNMITNGTMLSKYVDKVIELGVDEIIFSLDGPEEIHDEIRSGDGVFKRAAGAFGELYEAKKKMGSITPRVNINTTIFESNYRRLGEVLGVAESLGADAITFHHLIFLSKAVCVKNSSVFQEEFGLSCMDWEGFARETLPDIDVDELIGILGSLKKRASPVAVSVYPNFTDQEMRKYYGGFEFMPDTYANRCVSPWMTVYMFPNGDVKPCLDTCFIAGNLNTASFREIWNNDQFRTYRKVLRKRGSFPACTRCTEYYRS